VHLERGELGQAEQAFKEAIEHDIEFGPAHNNLGLVYFAQERFYEAAWEFEYARKQMPRNGEPLNNLGLIRERAGEYGVAADLYRQAIALDGSSIEYKSNLARTLVLRGDRTDELRHLLHDIVRRDSRPEWVAWARKTLVGLQAGVE
jgi:Flp pilus assembly protein TadD